MGVREKINASSRPVLIGAVTAVLASVSLIVWNARGFNGGKSPSQAFFTVDDGQSWFSDSVMQVPPFDHDGQQVVRAFGPSNASLTIRSHGGAC